MSGTASLFKRAKHICQAEGIVVLLRCVFSFLAYCLFQYRTYYLYAHYPHNDDGLPEAALMPQIEHLSYRTISTDREADLLEADGFEFRSHCADSRERLEKGAVALCIFISLELANVVWVATTQQAKDSLKQPPFKVDFSKNEVCVGNGWSNPKYRRMGLRVYGHLKGSHFLLDKGIAVSRYAIAKGNFAARMSTEKVDLHPYAEGRYLRILWWKSWRERPLSVEEQEAIGQTNEPHN